MEEILKIQEAGPRKSPKAFAQVKPRPSGSVYEQRICLFSEVQHFVLLCLLAMCFFWHFCNDE